MLWLVSFAFSKEEDDNEHEEHGKSEKIMFTCILHPVIYFHPSFCMQLLFHMFSTLMSLEEIETENENFLVYGYNSEQAPICRLMRRRIRDNPGTSSVSKDT